MNKVSRNDDFSALERSVLHDKEDQLKQELNNFSERRRLKRRLGESILDPVKRTYDNMAREREYNRRINFYDDSLGEAQRLNRRVGEIEEDYIRGLPRNRYGKLAASSILGG